jgi:hypothetical protein
MGSPETVASRHDYFAWPDCRGGSSSSIVLM